jgi:hypothetical protein
MIDMQFSVAHLRPVFRFRDALIDIRPVYGARHLDRAKF